MQNLDRNRSNYAALLISMPARYATMQQRQAEEQRHSILRTIMDDATVRYLLPSPLALTLIIEDAPLPSAVRTNITWPHMTTMYVEYYPPLLLDPITNTDKSRDHIHGLLIEPSMDSSKITTLGSKDDNILTFTHILDHATGRVSTPPANRDLDLLFAEMHRTGRFFARIADTINRHEAGR